jgi:hypothetical protein
LLQQVFSGAIASHILKTLFVAQVQQDHLIWKAEKDDIYSVKSAYCLCVEEVVDVSHLRKPGFWSGKWKLEVPPKIKNLI